MQEVRASTNLYTPPLPLTHDMRHTQGGLTYPVRACNGQAASRREAAGKNMHAIYPLRHLRPSRTHVAAAWFARFVFTLRPPVVTCIAGCERLNLLALSVARTQTFSLKLYDQ